MEYAVTRHLVNVFELAESLLVGVDLTKAILGRFPHADAETVNTITEEVVAVRRAIRMIVSAERGVA